MIPQEKVLAELAEPIREKLPAETLLSPEGRVKQLRKDIRELESTVIYLQGQQDLIQSQKTKSKRAELDAKREALIAEKDALETKRYAGMDKAELESTLTDLGAQYSELFNDDSDDSGLDELDKQLYEQTQKLASRSASTYESKFTYDNLAYDSDVDAAAYCRRAEELFELYQTCANRKQIETICLNFVRSLEATKMSVNGHLYFVPKHSMEKVDIFEDFMEALSSLNKTKSRLMANSIYIIDDAKQRDKMTEEFYAAVKKEIAEYQERADYLIKSGSQSPAIMERWVMKIGTLEGKKRHYEQVLRRELDGLDEEFESLKLLSQELSLRASGIRFQRAA